MYLSQYTPNFIDERTIANYGFFYMNRFALTAKSNKSLKSDDKYSCISAGCLNHMEILLFRITSSESEIN